MEVHGEGGATVTVAFAGEEGESKNVTLPFEASQNAGFGFTTLYVDKARPGTVCKIFVDDVLRQEKTADESGKVGCSANNQD